jgi:nucleotide-binding universal stress UspA family protein
MDTAGRHSGRIVVGIDGSEASKDALRWAARQAELTGAPLQAVTSWHMPMSFGAGMIPQGDYDPEADARSMLVKVVEEITRDNTQVTVESVVLEGPPALELLKVADGAQLLVVGSRGHGAFAGMLLGSVSAHCISHAQCPVVVVHHKAPSVLRGEPTASPALVTAS